MYPLLVKDGLVLPCWALAVIFCLSSSYLLPMKQSRLTLLLVSKKLFAYHSYISFFLQCVSSVICLLMLCAGSHVILPPTHLPDLFPVLISGYSCILFLIFWLYLNITQLYCKQRSQLNTQIIHKHLKDD